MPLPKRTARKWASVGASAASVLLLACCARSRAGAANTAAAQAEPQAETGSAPQFDPADRALPAAQTDGFDGQRAYDFTARLVSFGPRPPGSDAIHRTQDYLASELKGFGCQVETDDFHASTPVGLLGMKNVIAKIPGSGRGILLLLTHYDTVRLAGFVGAEDGGSSTGLMLEMARVLCGGKVRQANSVWIGFLDGEEDQAEFSSEQEAQTVWDTANTLYGSRELAARMELSGALKRTRAVILADMVGQKNLRVPPEASSTKWLTRLTWSTADRLGYGNVFVPGEVGPVTDDHDPFLQRRVAAVDVIDLGGYMAGSNMPYWHTTQDTMDKVSAHSLSIVGHVIVETLGELQRKFR